MGNVLIGGATTTTIGSDSAAMIIHPSGLPSDVGLQFVASSGIGHPGSQGDLSVRPDSGTLGVHGKLASRLCGLPVIAKCHCLAACAACDQACQCSGSFLQGDGPPDLLVLRRDDSPQPRHNRLLTGLIGHEPQACST
jgi:hypothetical protein